MLPGVSALALALILVAAFSHATWNLAAKKSGGGLPFVWLSGSLALLLYVPVVATYWWWQRPVLPAGTLFVIVGSGFLKTAYALLLQRGYRRGDFSLIYPLARGTGPLLSTLAAILIFGEHPTPLALLGGAIIITCVFYLAGGFSWAGRTLWVRHGSAETPHPTTAILYGLACGAVIAAYTVWDQHAVSHLHLPPVVYDAGTQTIMCCILTPFAWPRRAEVAREWREHRWHALTVAALASFSYVLILTAMKFTPVSYIAPAREISIVIGAFFGARLLKEAESRRRLLAAAGMVVGVIALALG